MIKNANFRLIQVAMMCCFSVMFAACDDFFVSEDNPISSYLSINTRPVTIKVGDTYQRTATSTSTAVVEYSSNDTSVATVDNNGLVTGVSEGETSIIATATGYSKQTGKKIYVPVSLSYQVTVKPLGTSSGTTPTPSPAPAAPTPATVTTAPAAPSGDVNEFTATALVTAGVADGGTIMYKVTTTNAKPTTTDGFDATLPTAAALKEATYYVWYYVKADADHTDSDISASAVTTTVKEPAITLSTPMTMKALTAGTIIIKEPQVNMQYSKNNSTKIKLTSNDDVTIDVNKGDIVSFYGNGTSITYYYNGTPPSTSISGGTADVKLYGNIMSLVDETGFATNKVLTAGYSFSFIFKGNTHLKEACGLLLPATTLAVYCYGSMFDGCTNLNSAPKLPATTLTDWCYICMFRNCSSLTTAPELPATTLKKNCYNSMFEGCSNLTVAPELPAPTLVESCYYDMFYKCSKLCSVTCLATDISATGCTTGWLSFPGVSPCGTETFTKAAGMSGWTLNSEDGIPYGWTVKNK